MESTSSKDSSKREIAGYRILNKLGKGNFADVYLVLHIETNKHYAIKSISKQYFQDNKLLTCLDSEINIMKDLNHPNLLKLYDKFSTNRNFNLVLEYCAGGDLNKYIKSEKKLPESLANNFLYQLVDGLHFLYINDYMHRDLKPANVLLTEASPNAILKIADFGFAKHLTGATMATTRCGTPLYMAPEILECTDYNISADVWSLGCIFFEMLIGFCPYSGRNELDLLKNIKSKNYNNNSYSLLINFSKDTYYLLDNMLKIKPEARMKITDLYKFSVEHKSKEKDKNLSNNKPNKNSSLLSFNNNPSLLTQQLNSQHNSPISSTSSSSHLEHNNINNNNISNNNNNSNIINNDSNISDNSNINSNNNGNNNKDINSNNNASYFPYNNINNNNMNNVSNNNLNNIANTNTIPPSTSTTNINLSKQHPSSPIIISNQNFNISSPLSNIQNEFPPNPNRRYSMDTILPQPGNFPPHRPINGSNMNNPIPVSPHSLPNATYFPSELHQHQTPYYPQTLLFNSPSSSPYHPYQSGLTQQLAANQPNFSNPKPHQHQAQPHQYYNQSNISYPPPPSSSLPSNFHYNLHSYNNNLNNAINTNNATNNNNNANITTTKNLQDDETEEGFVIIDSDTNNTLTSNNNNNIINNNNFKTSDNSNNQNMLQSSSNLSDSMENGYYHSYLLKYNVTTNIAYAICEISDNLLLSCLKLNKNDEDLINSDTSNVIFLLNQLESLSKNEEKSSNSNNINIKKLDIVYESLQLYLHILSLLQPLMQSYNVYKGVNEQNLVRKIKNDLYLINLTILYRSEKCYNILKLNKYNVKNNIKPAFIILRECIKMYNEINMYETIGRNDEFIINNCKLIRDLLTGLELTLNDEDKTIIDSIKTFSNHINDKINQIEN